MTIAIVTTVSTNYLPLARVLMNSVALHHPDAQRFVLLLDEAADVTETMENAVVLRPEDIVPDELERTIQQAIYKPIEYATALKPKLMLHALQNADEVYFLDPDMRLYQPMTAAQEALRASNGVLLTPHRITAPSYEERGVFEWTFKAYGIWNTAFVGITEGGIPFLDWWDSRLRRDCLADLRGMEWVDQRIVDLAPSYFDIDIFKDPAYNVAWWNLAERPLHVEDDTWFAGPGPLVLMHFSGVRSKARGQFPQLLHSYQNPISKDPAQLAIVQDLEDGYVAELQAAGWDDYYPRPYGLTTTAGGQKLTDKDRLRYREAVVEAEEDGLTPPRPDEISWALPARLNQSVRLLEFPRGLVRDLRKARKALASHR